MQRMLNQAAVEALYNAQYVEDYLECVDNLPNDLQRNVSQLRELDTKYQELLQEVDQYQENLQLQIESAVRKRTVLQLQHAFLKCQELGDEKLNLVSQITDLVENRQRQLEIDYQNLDIGQDVELPAVTQAKVNKKTEAPKISHPEKTAPKRARRQKVHPDEKMKIKDVCPDESKKKKKKSHLWNMHKPKATSNKSSSTNGEINSDMKESRIPVAEKVERVPPTKSDRLHPQKAAAAKPAVKVTNTKEAERDKTILAKKKRRKLKQEKRSDSPEFTIPVLPDEPTYCLCEQVSYGEMIGCDYDSCSIEWFHFQCVNLVYKPKGKWYCPNCRGDKSNVCRFDKKK